MLCSLALILDLAVAVLCRVDEEHFQAILGGAAKAQHPAALIAQAGQAHQVEILLGEHAPVELDVLLGEEVVGGAHRRLPHLQQGWPVGAIDRAQVPGRGAAPVQQFAHRLASSTTR